jgi:Domain of unknown function (DUF4388)
VALEGTIKDFGLPDIFQLIGLQRKTGILTLKSDKDAVTVVFENGMVVSADSAQKRLEDRLGNVLVKQNRISKERLESVLETQRQTLQRLGHILISSNAITAKDLKDALQVQVSQIVFKVFRWRDGEYHFAPTETADYDRENMTPMSADFILMEGIRMVDEWPIIEKKIPSMDIVFRAAVDPHLVEVKGKGPDDDEGAAASSKIRLGADEERIFRKVDGVRTVQGVIDSTGLSDFEVCRVLFDFLNRNIIAPIGRGGTARDITMVETRVPVSPVMGYVLIGAAALLSLLGLVAQASTPFGLIGANPLLDGGTLLESVNHTRLERLDRAIMAHQLLYGGAPRRLDELVPEGLVDASYLKDPWSRPYHYALTEGGYLLNGVDERGKMVPGSLIERAIPRQGS